MPENKERLTVKISGKVQGVFFRANIQKIADSLGIIGWTRNESDDSVKVVAEGENEKLEDFLAFLKKGPDSATVTNIETIWEKATGEFDEFDIRY